jgi:alpha-tubulin suppressor-like RCC1 family protein
LGWGFGTKGLVGDGTTVSKSSPVQIGALSDWAQVAAGAAHSIAVKTNGTIWAWGLGSSGQLGDGSIVAKSSPVQIGSLTVWEFSGYGWASNSSIGLSS